MSRLFATDYDLTAKRAVVWDLYLSSLTPRGSEAHTGVCWVSLRLCAHYLLHKCCHLLWSKECCVDAFAFPSQWTHLAFPQITHWLLLAVQNNFLGWLYAIYCQSKLQLCAEMARKQPKKRRGDRGDQGQQDLQLHGFLEKPFNKIDKQQNIPFTSPMLKGSSWAPENISNLILSC